MYQQPPQQPPGWAPPPGYPPQGYAPQGYGPPPPKKTSAGTIVIAVLIGFCGLCCIGAALNKQNGPGSTSPSAPSAAPAARQYIPQTCSEVSHLFGMQSRTTELQQTELWRQYDGRWVRWTVHAGEVGETLGQLQMQFKCGTESLLFDGHAYFPDAARARLLQVQQGSQVQIEGRLGDHGRLLGLRIDDAELR